jgi:tRNA A-37 threonylcarbamoyl transferase component Bud32
LQEECKLLMDAHSKCPENVIGVERPVVELRQGAALVLSQVGRKLRRTDFARIMRSLQKLHVKDIIHGDARLANVVDVEGRVMWLDFRHSRPLPTIQQKILDLESLLKSLLSPTSHSRNIITPIAQAYDGNNVEEIILSFRQPMQATLSKIPVWRR